MVFKGKSEGWAPLTPLSDLGSIDTALNTAFQWFQEFADVMERVDLDTVGIISNELCTEDLQVELIAESLEAIVEEEYWYNVYIFNLDFLVIMLLYYQLH